MEELKGKWFIIYVKNNKEMTVKNTLDCFCVVPMVQVARKKGSETIAVFIPRYTSYVYVQHDGSKDFFERVLLHEDVVCFVGAKPNQLPPEVPQPALEEAKLSAPRISFQLHTRVKVVDGPFKDLVGNIKQLKDEGCEIVFLILGTEVTEWIPKEYLIVEE